MTHASLPGVSLIQAFT